MKSPISFATVEVTPPNAMSMVESDADEGEASSRPPANGYDSAMQATAMRPPTVHMNPRSTVFAISFKAPRPINTSKDVK